MRYLTDDEVNEVSGAIFANIGMGIGGATLGMAAYSLQGGIRGEMAGSGFLGSAVAGFVTGFGGFTPAAGIAGAAMGGAAEALAEDNS